MNVFLRIVIDALLCAGAFFALVGTIGLLRMPDTFSRMQASTSIATLGVFSAALGALLYAVFVEHSTATAVKIVLIVLFILLTSPVAGHAICRAAYRRGNRPDVPFTRDDYGRDEPYD